MKKSCLIAVGICLGAVCQAFGQTNKEYYDQFFEGSQKKDSTVIKDVISRWEKDFPNSCELLIARFNYYILKGMDEMLVTTVTPPRGNQQCLALKDSLGNECGYLYSKVFFKEDYYAKAEKCVKQGIEIFPNRIDLREGLIYMYIMNEDYTKAVDELSSMVRYSPEINDEWCGLYDEPCDKKVYFGDLQNYFAEILDADDEDLSNSKAYTSVLVEVYNDNAIFHADAAYLLLAENKIDEAIDEYKLASKYDPTDYLIYQNLGYLSERKGDIDSAIEYYSKSRKYSTDEEYKAQIAEGIKTLKEQKKKKK